MRRRWQWMDEGTLDRRGGRCSGDQSWYCSLIVVVLSGVQSSTIEFQ